MTASYWMYFMVVLCAFASRLDLVGRLNDARWDEVNGVYRDGFAVCVRSLSSCLTSVQYG